MVLKFLFVIFLSAPLFSWGFSLDKVKEYQAQASAQKLWQDPQWLKLGHYRSGLFGFKSPLAEDFFISKSSDDPQAELLATIEALFRDPASAQKYQCRYLARLSWLKNKLSISNDDLITCNDRDLWKQKLGATEIYIVFAASDLSSAAASFGHTFLRLHNPKNTRNMEILDYGVNYAAVTEKDGGALYALKGVFGFYPGAYSMLPYHQKIREYSNLEGRSLWEYRLDFSPEEVTFLIDHLLEIDQSYAPYYFTNDNCSEQIMELLEVVKPQSGLTSAYRDLVIPLDTVKQLKKKNLLKEEIFRISLQTDWQARYAALSFSQRLKLKSLAQESKTGFNANSFVDANAEVLEAAMSYLAIQEYRDEGDFKEAKYKIAVERARLRTLTDPIKISSSSPLSSADSQLFYLGFGQYNQLDFYRFKYRRASHDLLSNHSGLSAFSHMEIFSFDFRYFSKAESLNLQKFILFKTMSTAPVTLLDTPLSWKLEIGTEPKLSPFAHIGVGYSFDFSVLGLTRVAFMGLSENDFLASTAQPHLGIETLLMNKSPWFNSYLSVKGLHNTSEGRDLWDLSLGLGTEMKKLEYRLELRARDTIPEIQFSVVF